MQEESLSKWGQFRNVVSQPTSLASCNFNGDMKQKTKMEYLISAFRTKAYFWTVLSFLSVKSHSVFEKA